MRVDSFAPHGYAGHPALPCAPALHRTVRTRGGTGAAEGPPGRPAQAPCRALAVSTATVLRPCPRPPVGRGTTPASGGSAAGRAMRRSNRRPAAAGAQAGPGCQIQVHQAVHCRRGRPPATERALGAPVRGNASNPHPATAKSGTIAPPPGRREQSAPDPGPGSPATPARVSDRLRKDNSAYTCGHCRRGRDRCARRASARRRRAPFRP